jgi:outer membrane protein assembly factor BamE (lipoprotein component of BamABCDE complex)
MQTRFILPLLLTLSGLALAGCTSAPAPAAGTGSVPSAQITAIKGQFPVLKRGMSADDVRQKLGNPAEILPMESPTGKAEVWVYNFEKTVSTSQIASSTRDVPAFGAPLSLTIMTSVPEPVYTLKEDKAVITLSLLMFNHHLAAQKAKVENSSDYK